MRVAQGVEDPPEPPTLRQGATLIKGSLHSGRIHRKYRITGRALIRPRLLTRGVTCMHGLRRVKIW